MIFLGVPRWLPGVIEEKLGPVTFTVRLADGRIWRRHQDHIKSARPDEGSLVIKRPASEQSPLTVELPPFRQPNIVDSAASNIENRSRRPPSETQVSVNTEPTVKRDSNAAVAYELPPRDTTKAVGRTGRAVKSPDRLSLYSVTLPDYS